MHKAKMQSHAKAPSREATTHFTLRFFSGFAPLLENKNDRDLSAYKLTGVTKKSGTSN